MPQYTLQQKIDAIHELQAGQSYEVISTKKNIPIGTLQKWYRQRATLRQAYQQQQQAANYDKMLFIQHHMADKAAELLAAMDTDRIVKAPLNQVASALGILIDRFLKLQFAQEEHDAANTEQVIRYEFRHPDGTLRETPYFAEGRSRHTGTLQGRGVREALGQDGTGENNSNGKSGLSWAADVVAGSDVSDGESGLAGFEDHDDERNWYYD
jgi:hypothetical protein